MYTQDEDCPNPGDAGATLQQLMSFTEENYDTLATKATQHSAKLLKKPDQCRAVYNCAHLFWPGTDEAPGHRDERRVLECLQKSLKTANTCMNQQVQLFVEILNKYLYFFERGCPSIRSPQSCSRSRIALLMYVAASSTSRVSLHSSTNTCRTLATPLPTRSV